jgi:hypothetical protein
MKDRHIQSFNLKYGNNVSYHDECVEIMNTGKFAYKEESTIDKMPYIGILYVPLDTNWIGGKHWWYDTDDDDWLRCKVIAIDTNTVTLVQYDSHHREIHILKYEHKGYAVKGNVLINLKELVER